jgi:hypothetical protein
MSQNFNTVPAFDGTNYGYWKARMRFFLKSIDCWSIVETGWTKPADATLELVISLELFDSRPLKLYLLYLVCVVNIIFCCVLVFCLIFRS